MSEPTAPTPNPYAYEPTAPTPQPGHPTPGYPTPGYQPQGYPTPGYQPQGYPTPGYPPQGAPYPYGQQPVGQPTYAYPGYPQPGYPGYVADPRAGGRVAPSPFGPAALAVAIAALLISVLSAAAVGLWTVVACVVALAAIGLGITGVTRSGTKGLAIAGIATGTVALLLASAVSASVAADVDDVAGPVQTVDPGTDDDPATSPLDGVVAPQGALASGGIPVGTTGIAGAEVPAGTVVVDVYLDYMCPACASFEEANRASLAELRATGGVTVVYHPVAILDYVSMDTDYSTRAATAAALVADQAPEAFEAFNAAMFAGQPGENTEGLTDTAIAAIAAKAGVPDAVAATMASGAYLTGDASFTRWVSAATDQATADLGPLSTPTILIDGVPFAGEWWVPGPLEDALIEARG